MRRKTRMCIAFSFYYICCCVVPVPWKTSMVYLLESKLCFFGVYVIQRHTQKQADQCISTRWKIFSDSFTLFAAIEHQQKEQKEPKKVFNIFIYIFGILCEQEKREVRNSTNLNTMAWNTVSKHNQRNKISVCARKQIPLVESLFGYIVVSIVPFFFLSFSLYLSLALTLNPWNMNQVGDFEAQIFQK